MKKLLILASLLLFGNTVFAETITVKYRDSAVDVSNGHFKELDLKPSSFVNRIIYDKGNSYLLVELRNTFYHYCGIPKSEVQAWQTASSLGRYYSSRIKGNYDCRVNPLPKY